MKKIVYTLLVSTGIILVACHGNGSDNTSKPVSSREAMADTLEKQVLEGHDIAMPKSMRIPDLQKQATKILDSIANMPAKAREAAAPYKAKLDTLLKELSYADVEMNKWMDELRIDSARNDIDQRIKYLADEKLRVAKVKEVVLNSVNKADSLLKAKF